MCATDKREKEPLNAAFRERERERERERDVEF